MSELIRRLMLTAQCGGRAGWESDHADILREAAKEIAHLRSVLREIAYSGGGEKTARAALGTQEPPK